MKKTFTFTFNTLFILALLIGIGSSLIDTTFSIWILGTAFVVFIVKEIFLATISGNNKKLK